MSNAWSFSSFGLEEEALKDNVNENNRNTDSDEDDILNGSNGDHNIFFTNKPRLPMMIKNKPWKRFLPDFSQQFNTNFRDLNHVKNEPHTIMIGKRQTSTETNKCKWTKSKINAIDSRFLVKAKEMKEFFKLTGDPVISEFLKMDSCKRIADKYLIAMVFAYFKRADFDIKDYNRTNFFVALYSACNHPYFYRNPYFLTITYSDLWYLANDVEEDEEEIKYEILPWAIGKQWRETYVDFLRERDCLFRKIDYKAIISRKCCDEIINIEPDNILWKRERGLHHAGALRGYMKDPRDTGVPRGPDASPLLCLECDASDSQYDSSSPNSLNWLISADLSPCDS